MTKGEDDLHGRALDLSARLGEPRAQMKLELAFRIPESAVT